jgi:hypothetical protein
VKGTVGKSWLVAVTLLIIAQAGAIAHAFEHDPGMHQDKICASCVTASQLSSACVGSVTVPEFHFSVSFLDRSRQVFATTACVQIPRQRGPPLLS